MKYIALIGSVMILTLFTLHGFAQEKLFEVSIKGIVIDDLGKTMANQRVESLVSNIAVQTDANGAFEIKTATNDVLVVKKEGYVDATINIREGVAETDAFTLVRNNRPFAGKKLDIPLGTSSFKDLSGAVTVVSGDEIRRFGGNNLFEALKGKVAGLRSTGSKLEGRGGAPLILVDGIPQPIGNIDLVEIDEVYYFPDYSTASVMGPLAYDGALYVKTNRTVTNRKEIVIDYQHGIDFTAREPKFMDAYNYALTNNTIRENDGLPVLYDQVALDAYQNNLNSLLYPNLKLKDVLLNDTRQTDRLGASLLGQFGSGNYYFYGGYESVGGLEKVGQKQTDDRFSFNSQVNIEVNKFIAAQFGVNGNYNSFKRSTFSEKDLMNSINTLPPNAFPLMLGDSVYIANLQYRTNPLAAMREGGYIKEVTSNILFDARLHFDLNSLVNGLSYSTNLMVNNSSVYGERLYNQPELFRIENFDTEGQPILERQQSESFQLTPSNNGVNTNRLYAYSGVLDYDIAFGEHSLNSRLVHYLYWNELKGKSIDARYLFYSWNTSYHFQRKYIVDFNLSYNGSQKFMDGKRFDFFPSLGLAWLVSEEPFIEKSQWIDFLKLRGSYGIIGKDPDSEYLFQTIWGNGENGPYYGINNQGINITGEDFRGIRQLSMGNPNISWVDVRQFTVGIDALLWANKVYVQANYYNQEYDGFISFESNNYSELLGLFSAYLPAKNFNETRSNGFEGTLTYTQHITNDLSVRLGVNYSYHINKSIVDSGIDFPDTYRNTTGKATDIIWGLESNGRFQDEADIANSDLQLFGNVRPGDIKYVDQNGDDLIDARDVRAIGNSTPKHNYGISIDFSYKEWNLALYGYGMGGYQLNLNGNKYYQVGYDNNYPVEIDKLPNGREMPRLSAMSESNNYRNSDYWLVDGGMFRLSNAELGYTLPQSLSSKLYCKYLKLFLRANNLFTISLIDDLDPEDMDKGLTSYPAMRSVALGATIRF